MKTTPVKKMLFRIGDYTGCDHGRDGINCVHCALRWHEVRRVKALGEVKFHIDAMHKLQRIRDGLEPYPNPDGSTPEGEPRTQGDASK